MTSPHPPTRGRSTDARENSALRIRVGSRASEVRGGTPAGCLKHETSPAPFTLSVGCASLTRSNGLRTAFERFPAARAVRIDTRGRGVELQFSRANHAAKHVARQLSNASKASVPPLLHESNGNGERMSWVTRSVSRVAKCLS